MGASGAETAASDGSLTPRAVDLCMNVNLRPGETIGSGSFGRVFTAQHMVTGALVAVKEVLLKKEGESCSKEEQEALLTELEFCGVFAHPNIVQYLGQELRPNSSDPERLYLFLEYCSGGSVASQLGIFGPLDNALIARHTQQLLSGLGYLHSMSPPVAHRDLKCANILLTQDGVVKLADFGCAKRMGPEDAKPGQHVVVGSVYWAAPEMLEGAGPISVAVDIWSLGCCLLEMATAAHPWASRKLGNILHAWKVISRSDELPDIPENIETWVQGFIRACLQRVPSQRPSTPALTQRLQAEWLLM